MKTKRYMGMERDKIDWNPIIDIDKCTGCGACAEFCPNEVYDLVGESMTVAKPLNCVPACDKCEGECPVSAITFPSKESLLQQIENLRRS